MSEASERADLDVERIGYHAERPGFRIAELRISPTQCVPWHRHSHIADTFYVLAGRVRVGLQNPDEEVVLEPGQVCGPVPAGRPHQVTNAGDTSATFLVLHGLGDYDFIPVA
jgi:quercetin dioxygenase-like cupin family protein